jgi:hypothetical protein
MEDSKEALALAGKERTKLPAEHGDLEIQKGLRHHSAALVPCEAETLSKGPEERGRHSPLLDALVQEGETHVQVSAGSCDPRQIAEKARGALRPSSLRLLGENRDRHP